MLSPIRNKLAGPTALLLAASLLAGAPAEAKTVSYSRSASSGKPQKIDVYSGWNDDCSFLTINVNVVKKPKSGAVTPRVEMSTIHAAQQGSAGKCLGKPTRGLAVYYRSKPGFKGRDSFTVRMGVRGQAPVDFVYNVSVR